MNSNELYEKLMDYFSDNEDDMNDVMEQLDSWDGFLGDDAYFPMDELYDFCNISSRDDFGDLMARIFYGHDQYGDGTAFNPNREYFSFNGYGNLVSSDYKDYSGKLDDYFIDEVIENRDQITLPDGIEEIFDEYDDSNQDDDSDN